MTAERGWRVPRVFGGARIRNIMANDFAVRRFFQDGERCERCGDGP